MPDLELGVEDFPCPCCKDWLFAIYLGIGSRTPESVPLSEDEHGIYSICPSCKKLIRMVQGVQDEWTIAPDQNCR